MLVRPKEQKEKKLIRMYLWLASSKLFQPIEAHFETDAGSIDGIFATLFFWKGESQRNETPGGRDLEPEDLMRKFLE